MQKKDDRFYTFLFTKTSRSRVYIRRVEISKKWLHTSAAAAVLTVGIATAGIANLTKVEGFQLAKTDSTAATIIADSPKAPVIETTTQNEVKAYNYERPDVTETSSNRTGGPATPFQLTNAETESEEDDMEAQLVNIQRTANPNSLPTMWAHVGKINNEFGFRRNPFGGRTYEFHPGMDIDGERGDSVIAPANGVVIKAEWQGGYGNLVEIDHGNGLTTRYGHLSKFAVQAGDTVQRGQEIALIGSTGRSTGPHLHFEIRLNDKAINPRRFLPPELPK